MASCSLPRIAILDSYYPEFLKTFPIDPSSTYDAELKRLMEFSFGTFDAWSRALRAHGWETLDIIANNEPLNRMWARENGYEGTNIIESQIMKFYPDVIFMQDLSLPLNFLFKPPLMAGQCSCRLTKESSIKRFDVVFTSIPSLMPRFEALDVKCIYNSLAFDPVVLQRMGPVSGERSGCVFIGGMGADSYWKRGTETLEAVAAAIPEFEWYGYGLETLSPSSPLRKCYRGPAWGLDYYRIMAKALIVINRHGEIAGDWAQNMRLFEASGSGAMLLTEGKSNLDDLFVGASLPMTVNVLERECVSYSTDADAIEKIRYFLSHPEYARAIGVNGQRRTLLQHTYHSRMKTISDELRRCCE